MQFDPEKGTGVGELVLIDIKHNKDIREKFDKLFEDVDGLSRIFCAVLGELQEAYRVWSIFGIPYISGERIVGVRREEPADILALWTEALTTRTVRLTDTDKRSVSVLQFPRLDLDPDLKSR